MHGRRLRVATKYLNLTRRFFASAGVAGYRIVESVGATEGTPAAGTAELIVDITTTGTTLAANHLKVLEDGLIHESQAHLFAARGAEWTKSTIRLRDAILLPPLQGGLSGGISTWSRASPLPPSSSVCGLAAAFARAVAHHHPPSWRRKTMPGSSVASDRSAPMRSPEIISAATLPTRCSPMARNLPPSSPLPCIRLSLRRPPAESWSLPLTLYSAPPQKGDDKG